VPLPTTCLSKHQRELTTTNQPNPQTATLLVLGHA
jgi:hypothetical protein